MPNETVTVAFVNEPKANPKYGSIKTEAGDFISVDVDRLALFRPGGTYEIVYELDKGKYKTFKSMLGAAPANAPSAPTAPARANVTGSTAEDIFVAGAINNILSASGTCPDAEMIATWVRNLRKGYRDGASPF
jgi:hypothetical protein